MNARSAQIMLMAFLPFYSCLSAGNEREVSGPRSLGMGGTSLCLTDAWCTSNNQAGMAFLQTPEIALSGENYFLMKELKQGALGLVFPVKGGAFGLSVSEFGYVLYNESKYGLGFAKTLGRNFAAGAQLDYLQTYIAQGYGNKGTAVGELSVQGKVLNGLSFGIHLFNPTRSQLAAYNDERIPTILRAGLQYQFSPKVLLALETEKDNLYPGLFRIGLEYTPAQSFFLRAGFSTGSGAAAFGFGFQMNRLKIDFSSSWHMLLGYSPSVGFRYLFTTKNKEETSTGG